MPCPVTHSFAFLLSVLQALPWARCEYRFWRSEHTCACTRTALYPIVAKGVLQQWAWLQAFAAHAMMHASAPPCRSRPAPAMPSIGPGAYPHTHALHVHVLCGPRRKAFNDAACFRPPADASCTALRCTTRGPWRAPTPYCARCCTCGRRAAASLRWGPATCRTATSSCGWCNAHRCRLGAA